MVTMSFTDFPVLLNSRLARFARDFRKSACPLSLRPARGALSSPPSMRVSSSSSSVVVSRGQKKKRRRGEEVGTVLGYKKRKNLQAQAEEVLNRPTYRCLLYTSPPTRQSVKVGMKLDACRRVQGRSDWTVCDLEVNCC